MGDTQSKPAGSKKEDGDKYLQTFHKLNPPPFKETDDGLDNGERNFKVKLMQRSLEKRRDVYEIKFITLARYAPHLIPTTKEKCYRFLQGLNRDLRHPLLVEQVRLIEINLEVLAFMYDVGSKYNVSRNKTINESSRDRDNVSDKKSRYSNSRESGSKACIDSYRYNEYIHYGRIY
ncbi:hypothetical protein IEQ34_021750 [Dendrobium chrysotoxum]|uniref:Uncharacterized protein n=1 Tax=Dendrobium chrysotoxum TaxID=161865 RepID=A0AAV7G5R4_DENCH|nr:hypothetical protein IEQ34_021750 [Dendrobium chrysotoxum]